MAYAPIALTLPQYDSILYAGWWMKAYNQGTTIPLSVATDAAAGTLLVKCLLDSQGFPITSAVGPRFIPFIDGDYDLWLFPTEGEADGNITINAIQLADNLNTDATPSAIANVASYAAAGGTVDVIVATLTPAITSYADGLQLNIRASGANTSVTPTLNVNGVGAKTITKLGDLPIRAGDIPKTDYEAIFRYNLTNDVFELLNPALYPPLPGGVGELNFEYEGSHIYRYIPSNLHAGISAGTDTTDLSTYIQNAIDSLLTSLWFPSGEYTTSTELTVDHNINISGELAQRSTGGGVTIENTGTGNCVTWSITKTLYDCGIKDIELKSTTGHALDIFKGSARCRFLGMRMFTRALDKSCVEASYDTSGGMYSCLFEGGSYDVNNDPARTAPIINLTGNVNLVNENIFRNLWLLQSASVHAINLKMGATGTYLYNNVFESLNFEICAGGAFSLAGNIGTTIKDCTMWDTPAGYDNDIIEVDTDTGVYQTKALNIDGYIRAGDSLNGGVSDISLGYSTATNIKGFAPTSGTNKIDFNDKTCVVIGAMPTTAVNTSRTTNLNGDSKFTLQSTISSDLTIATGVITVTGSYHKLDTESGDPTDELDTINGGEDGMRLVLGSVTSVRDVTVAHATGNIRLAGGVDFAMTGSRDIIELIYDDSLSNWLEISRSANT